MQPLCAAGFAAFPSSPCPNRRHLALLGCTRGDSHLMIGIPHELHPGVASNFVLLDRSPNPLLKLSVRGPACSGVTVSERIFADWIRDLRNVCVQDRLVLCPRPLGFQIQQHFSNGLLLGASLEWLPPVTLGDDACGERFFFGLGSVARENPTRSGTLRP